MKIKAYLIDVEHETHKMVEIENRLEDYYRELQCSVIDIQERRLGGRTYDIICDDEGLFRDPAKISAIDNMGQPMFVGNLLVVKSDNGETTTLTDEDVDFVSGLVETMYTKLFPKGYPMLTQVEY